MTWFSNEVKRVGRGRRQAARARRGVASVLAMMFLVVFSSLAAAMAVVAQGNLRTADSALKVSRAMSAAETGLVFASRRLSIEGRRFVVDKGVVTPAFAEDLWLGTYNEAVDGAVVILPPTGYVVGTPPAGMAHAVRDAHLADAHSIVVEAGDSSLPELNTATGTLRVRPIRLEEGDGTAYFRLRYELVDGESAIRVTSIGVDADITRTLQMDFKIEKRIEYAIISPNRIMIGKNVRVEGPLGSRYGMIPGELDSPNGDPLVMRSDFYNLDKPTLDANLDTFFAQLVAFDVDGDGRLRPNHPTEQTGLVGHPALQDYNGDEYVDEMDLFMAAFDDNNDQRVVYDAARAAAAGLGGLSEEFTVDPQLGRLIDLAFPDRNGDGIVNHLDTALGYNNGVIDSNDLYAKVHGRLMFAVQRDAWDTANGASYQTVVHGPIRPNKDQAAVTFEASSEELREITTDMFGASQNWFDLESQTGSTFAVQVANNNPAANYTAPGPLTWEDVPFGSNAAGAAAYDWYQRPQYRNMTFTNLRIPVGTNALFENCTFKGVTYIETEPNCTHYNWNYAGARTRVESPPGSGIYLYVLKFAGQDAELNGNPVADTKPHSNNIRFHNCTFLGTVSGLKPNEYTHWRNKVQYTGNTRFYIDTEDEDLATQPDAATLIGHLAGMSPTAIDEMEKSSILLPGWSVDVGSFTNEAPKVKLKGVIIAGILDARGTVDVHGTMLMTYRPVEGEGPLYYGGMMDAFNTTIGYFPVTDGDGEGTEPLPGAFGEITLRYNPDAKLPDGIPWPVRVVADPLTYNEGGL